ncbi:MAG: MFS transporter small subunit [Gammaproteobacteria bacterium]
MNSKKTSRTPHPVLVVLFWLYVSLPLTWGIWSTLKKSLALFN